MNYAEDRLDRRARHVDSSSGLWADYQRGLELLREPESTATSSSSCSLSCTRQGHALLGRTLRDIGWCRHATYHYGMAWRLDCSISSRNQYNSLHCRQQQLQQQGVGDYAQMAELAGFPEVGVLALLYHRMGGTFASTTTNAQESVPLPATPIQVDPLLDPSNLRQAPPAGDCGCASSLCGRQLCFLPVSVSELEPILSMIDTYIEQCPSRVDEMPSAASLLAMLSNNTTGTPHTQPPIPPLLQFWNDDDPNYVALTPVGKLILVKLLYPTLPALAAEALVHLKFDNPRALAKDYKSHWAYYELIRAVVLGKRIKPHRRQVVATYHVPVWDLLWNKDERRYIQAYYKRIQPPREAENELLDTIHDSNSSTCMATSWSKHVRNHLESLSFTDMKFPPLITTRLGHLSMMNPSSPKPLFIVGDSHVLSMAWQTILVPTVSTTTTSSVTTIEHWEPRIAVPLVVTGLKAWHTQEDTFFFTHTLLHACLQRLPQSSSTCRTIVWSAGEIDCREGMGGTLLEGYVISPVQQQHGAPNDHPMSLSIRRTVHTYIHQGLVWLSDLYNLQILVLPVAPHAHRSDRNGKSTGRAFRRQAMQIWNDELRQVLPVKRVFLLDYETQLRHPEPSSPVGYVLNPEYNADYTHMNSAPLPFIEEAIHRCGFNVSLL